MVARDSETENFSPPSQETIAGWVSQCLNILENTLIKNSWHHAEYSYFLESTNIMAQEVILPPANGQKEDNGDPSATFTNI